MSGGHFEYKCFDISRFAQDLQAELLVNYDTSKGEWGDVRGMNFSPETMVRLRETQEVIAKAGELAHAVEWLYSGDYGEDTFNDVFDKMKEEVE